MSHPQSAASTDEALAARFESAIPARANSDAFLVWRGRGLTTDCMVGVGSIPFLMRIERGGVVACRRGSPLLASWDFAVRGSAAAWTALWQAPPPPGWHDLFALSKRGEMVFEGRLHPFLAHLQYFKDLLELPREGAG
jgi:hypothetical protein